MVLVAVHGTEDMPHNLSLIRIIYSSYIGRRKGVDGVYKSNYSIAYFSWLDSATSGLTHYSILSWK